MKRSRVLSAAALAAAVVATSVILGACSGGGGSAAVAPTPKMQLSGTIASGGSYTFGKTYYGKSLAAALPPAQVDKVVAIPMDRGDLQAWNMPSSVTGTIGTDGKFDLALPMDKDWLLVLINSSAAPADRFVGSLALNAGAGSTLLSLPATVSTLASFHLGTVTRIAGDAVSGATVTASDFGMNDSQFTAFANSDDVFKNAKNIINNYGTDGIWYQLRPDFTWEGDYAIINGAYSGPNWTYQSFNFQMDTNATNLTIQDLCVGGTGSFTNVGWTPPTDVPVVDSATVYGPGNPIVNSAATCTTYSSDGVPATQASGGAFYATDAYWGPYGTLSYSLPIWFAGPIPTGYGNWTWSEGGVVKASFDPSVSTPVNIDGVRSLGYVPSIKLTVAGGVITAVDVEWYYFDETLDDYTKVTTPEDFAVMKHFMDGYEIIFESGWGVATRRHSSFRLDPTVASQLHLDLPATGADSWTYANTICDPFLDSDAASVGVFYSSGGIGRYFFARAPFACI